MLWFCHALTGNHLTGTDEHPGWWREIIDGGYMPIYDYQFLTFNVIGSPFGSSSPLNDAHFPKTITLRDIVKAIELGIKALGFTKIDILIGGSLGGTYDGNYIIINKSALQIKLLHTVVLSMKQMKRFILEVKRDLVLQDNLDSHIVLQKVMTRVSHQMK